MRGENAPNSGRFKRKVEDHGYKKFVFPNQENKQVIYSF